MSKLPKGQQAKPPEQMTFNEARALLFPAQGRTRPASWVPWTKPSPALPIDDAVFGLISPMSGRAKLRDKELLAKKGISCPYAYARNGVALAVAMASVANEEAIRDSRKRLQADETRARELAAALAEFLHQVNNWNYAPSIERGTGRSDIDATNKALAEVNSAIDRARQAIPALNGLADMAKSERERLPALSTRANDWAATFAEGLCYNWFRLTGDQPTSPSVQLLDFVSAAYTSLGGEDAVSWEHQMRNALERAKSRPWWDKFDRYEERYSRPGEMTWEEFEKKRKRWEENWKEKMRAAMTMATSEDENIRRRAYFDLKLEYISGTPDERAFLESIGFHPPPIQPPAATEEK